MVHLLWGCVLLISCTFILFPDFVIVSPKKYKSSNISWQECKKSGLFSYRVLKTEDIHPPKTGISVHFSGSLV